MNNRAIHILRFLLLAQFIGVGIAFPYYALVHQETWGLRIFALAVAVLGVITLVGVWQKKAWSLWAVLTLVSCKITIDLFAWALALDRTPLLFLGELVNLAIIVLAFAYQMPWGTPLRRSQKIFYGFVLTLAALIAFRGLLLPERVVVVLPFSVPPLHARFLGSMYLSGATFMGFSIAAKEWYEVRVVTPMIAIWTGMLGLISLLHLEAFDWSRKQVWVWFIAYISFPLIAAWITWQQRQHRSTPEGLPLSPWLRTFLYLQGGLVTLLALSLFLAPAALAAVWPWKITPLLAHIYSAPFLSYGLGSFYAARQQAWDEVRIMIYATLVFTLGVLFSSLYHANLFNFASLSPWLWFGGFTVSSLALALLGPLPTLHARKSTP